MSSEYQVFSLFVGKIMTKIIHPQNVPKTIVGVEALADKLVKKHLKDYVFLGLCGVGGLGKTTTAKVLLNAICANFEYTCDVEEVKLIGGSKAEVKVKVWGQMRRWGNPVRNANNSYVDGEWEKEPGKSLLVVYYKFRTTWRASVGQFEGRKSLERKSVYCDYP